ncbi:CHAP domain-containing protein [Aquimarina sp. RZ0]|uniref:CHAP domain-containing protein n=1 Tax=Aquimarina sp. RZ0 TaxID=2607730 RepID=UPI0011F1CD03|nr:CHAP domain-containing protein [Aquimarina sp. RZ0]KAA1244032.1 CHAP domain-containing protein [Aquimarina sp. RZ0]
MNITFPAEKLKVKKFDSTTQFGNFLIGGENTWHGGIHIEGKDVKIKAIADGRIIAYRLEDGYKKVIKNEGTDTEFTYKYSNCFMIIQHDFELVKHITKNKRKENESTEKKVENVTFYSLYNHLLPINLYNHKDTSKNVKFPAFLAKKEYQTGENQKIKGLGVYKFEQDQQTKKFKKLKDTEVVLPVNTEFTLADDSKKENTIVLSYKRNGKTKTSTYKKLTPFKDLHGENHTDYYANVNSGISKKLTKTTYKVTYKNDISNIEGIPVRNQPSANAPIIKVLKSKKSLLTEAKAKNGFIAIKGKNEFVNRKHITAVYTLDESKYTKNAIVACDIPVKADQLIGYTGLKQSKAAQSQYYVCHHEIFMAPDNEDTIKKFLNNTFDIYSEEEKPLEKKQYYKLPEGATLYKSLKAPNNPTLKAKTPLKVLARKDKFCKVKMLTTVERTVEKGALSVNKEKSKGKKIVYDIVNFDYISKIFDGTVSKKDTLIHIADVKNTLVKVQYASKEKPWAYDFWIPFSDLSKNYKFTTESTPTKVYKSVRNEENILNYIITPMKPIEADNTRVSVSNFIPNDELDEEEGPENEIEEVGRKNVTKTTYNREIEKKVTGILKRSLMETTDGTLIKWEKNDPKEPKHHYLVNPKKTLKFNEINAVFKGKLSLTEVSRLFSNGSFYCNKNGIEGDKDSLYRGLTYIYTEKEEVPIVPNIIHEDEHVIQAILPVEVYKKFEISPSNYKILPVDNTGKDPKVHEDVDTLFAFFKNKLPNVSGFELKWKGACNKNGDELKSTNKDATHRIVEFNIDEFNKKQEVQDHILDRGYTPKINDEVGLIKDVTDIWLARPANKKDIDFLLEKPTVIKRTKEKDIIIGEEGGDFHYRQVKTLNLYLGNDLENVQTGWVKIDKFEDKKFFSPYNWEQFGFTILDGGDEYIYEIKDTLGFTETKSDFIKKIWENFNIEGATINADEVKLAMGLTEIRYEMSRVVAKHKSEWSYTYEAVKADVEKFYDAQINLAKKNKREQSVIDAMKSQKKAYLSNLNTQVTDLMFWEETAGKPYTPPAPKTKKTNAKKRDFGVTDQHRAMYQPAESTATTIAVATPTKPAETESVETKKETPQTPARIFPGDSAIYHFHPIAFINQMKLMFEEGKTGECFCNKPFTAEDLKRIITYVRYNTFYKDAKGRKQHISLVHKDHMLFHSSHDIPSSDQNNYEKLAEVLNASFAKRGITKCSHKIHYLANMYVETQYFSKLEESGNNHRYMPYKGRGFIHITHDYNYKAYSDVSGHENIVSGTNYKKVTSSLELAADTGSWFWEKNKVNEFAEKDDIFGTSKKINAPNATKTSQVNGYKMRRAAWIKFKEAFNNYPYNCVTDTSKNPREYGEGVLEEMRKWADQHVQYKQEGEWAGTKRTGLRSNQTEDALGRMDCSEFVCRYLFKLGVTDKMKVIVTNQMKTQESFRKKLGNDNIEFITGSDKTDFIPQAGDIFVWSRSDTDGHTGIVHSVDGDNITILEAIGMGGSSDENHNRNNEGYEGYNCTRTSVYQRTGRALASHGGWIGYYRPKNYTKQL